MTGGDPFAHDDAAYVLGALGPSQRRAFEEHLAGCTGCARAVRGLAGIPGLLARLDESAFTDPDNLPPVPGTLLPQLLRSVERQAWRIRLVAVLASVAAVILAVLFGVSLLGSRPDSTVVRAQEMTQVDQHGLKVRVVMQTVAWGTRMHLSCTYGGSDWGATSPPSYALVVHTSDGATQQVGTWRAVKGRTSEVDAATDTDQDQITKVDVVVVGTGRRVLTLSPTGS